MKKKNLPVPGTISYPLHTYILFTLANTQVGTYTCIDKACCCWKNMLGTIISLIIILAIIRSPAHMLWLIHAEPTPDPLKSVARAGYKTRNGIWNGIRNPEWCRRNVTIFTFIAKRASCVRAALGSLLW